MKYILNNPTEEQINALKQLGLCVYRTSEGIHYVDVPEIQEEELPKVDVVDLGLPSGLKWASCNIGANSPCESGLLFQFGRVDGYAYGDTNNKFRTEQQNTADTGSKFIPLTTSGKTYDAGAVLDSADDAAYVATNGKLRMPTAEEIDELLANTTNQWCQCTVLGEDHTSHNIYGGLFTSKADTSKKILIPAAGAFDVRGDGSFNYFGSHCDVWSSSVHTGDIGSGYSLFFNHSNCYRGNYIRCYGYSVRGVCK